MKNELIQDLVHVIKNRISGDVKVDLGTKTLYSTDASIYQIMPLGVVFPRDQDDLVEIVKIADQYDIPILPRGSGSSLAGQAVGAAMIIDCSKYLNKIIDVNSDSMSAIVEPGVILNELNLEAGKYGLKFGPDPASSDRATLGGMIGNNSTGAHSIQFGMTSDQILELETVLSDGSIANLKELTITEMEKKVSSGGMESKLYDISLKIRNKYSNQIRERWPKTWRQATGYNLNYLLPWSGSTPPQWQTINGQKNYPPVLENNINLAQVLVGSEGTLSVFKQAKLRLVPVPKKTVLGVLNFESVAEACDAVPEILKMLPSAVELLPKALIDRARSVPAYASRLSFVKGNPAALLIIEFEGDSTDKLIGQVRKLPGDVIVVDTLALQNQIWEVRKVGLGLLMSIKGDYKPLPFVEDVAVPVERLGYFVRKFEEIMNYFQTEGNFYAHASAGCLHIRPLINLKINDDIQKMRNITNAVVELTSELEGALSGEHGDGRARSEWLQPIFGEDITSLFGMLKSTLDPKGILNPGIKVDPDPMEENLRYGVDYTSAGWVPTLDFSSQSNIAGAIEMCNGAGVCRKSTGVMCPSFQATRNELHSTRGRANLLRSYISESNSKLKHYRDITFEALDLCLECKGCKAECPSGVDMAKLKYEYLNEYYSQNKRPFKDYVFGYINTFANLGKPFSSIGNKILKNKIVKLMMNNYLGISKFRDLPEIQKKSASDLISNSKPDNAKEEVFLLLDPFTEYFYPELAKKVVTFLEKIDCKVTLLPIIGAGRTYISKGFLKKAKTHAKDLVALVKKLDPNENIPVIGIEPSDIYTIRDEYLDFFPNDQTVISLSRRTYMIDEFLLRSKNGIPRIEKLADVNLGKIYIHGHCYQKAQPPALDDIGVGVQATIKIIEALGYEVELIESGCCGMAGSFGYESDHYELSMEIGELKLFPTIRKLNADHKIVACGVSCRAQIESGTDRKPVHIVDLISHSQI